MSAKRFRWSIQAFSASNAFAVSRRIAVCGNESRNTAIYTNFAALFIFHLDEHFSSRTLLAIDPVPERERELTYKFSGNVFMSRFVREYSTRNRYIYTTSRKSGRSWLLACERFA